jgi:hypothetical protein
MYILVLFEASREYVLHGPLLSINWLRLCPHLGGPRPKPRRPEEVVYSLNDSCSHFTQRLFPLKLPQQHTQIIFHSTSNIIHIYYTSHLYAHLHLLFCMSYSHTHFFGSSWQAGCPRLLVSDTRRLKCIYFCRLLNTRTLRKTEKGEYTQKC